MEVQPKLGVVVKTRFGDVFDGQFKKILYINLNNILNIICRVTLYWTIQFESIIYVNVDSIAKIKRIFTTRAWVICPHKIKFIGEGTSCMPIAHQSPFWEK